MSKSSTVTVRDQPVADVTSVAGALTVHGETITVQTDSRVQVLDLTERVMALVRCLRIREGIVNLFSMHTTCSVLVNEFQPALASDVRAFLQRLVGPDEAWKHDDPAHSDCDRFNADAHLRALLIGQTLSLQVSRGEVVLGQWQRVLLAELDGPRARSLRIQIMGVAAA